MPYPEETSAVQLAAGEDGMIDPYESAVDQILAAGLGLRQECRARRLLELAAINNGCLALARASVFAVLGLACDGAARRILGALQAAGVIGYACAHGIYYIRFHSWGSDLDEAASEDGEADGDSYAEADGGSDGDSYAEADGDPDVEADGGADAEEGGDADAEADGGADAEEDGDADAGANAAGDGGADAEADPGERAAAARKCADSARRRADFTLLAASCEQSWPDRRAAFARYRVILARSRAVAARRRADLGGGLREGGSINQVNAVNPLGPSLPPKAQKWRPARGLCRTDEQRASYRLLTECLAEPVHNLRAAEEAALHHSYNEIYGYIKRYEEDRDADKVHSVGVLLTRMADPCAFPPAELTLDDIESDRYARGWDYDQSAVARAAALTTVRLSMKTVSQHERSTTMFADNPAVADPRTLRELFPSRYLSAADLTRPTKVTIASITFETLRGREREERKALVWFMGARKCLVLNKTQATALALIAGSEEIAAWLDLTIMLAPARAPNGKDTIAILSASAGRTPAVPFQPAALELDGRS